MLNPVIVVAIIVQVIVSKFSRIAGAVLGYMLTTGILLWGISVYGEGNHIVWADIPLSQPVFLTACLVWYGFDTRAFIAAWKEISDDSDERLQMYPKSDPVTIIHSKGDADETSVYLEPVYVARERGEFRSALDTCEIAIQQLPASAEAYNLQGLLLEDLGRPEEALEAYRTALQLDSKFDDARLNLLEAEAEWKKQRD